MTYEELVQLFTDMGLPNPEEAASIALSEEEGCIRTALR